MTMELVAHPCSVECNGTWPGPERRPFHVRHCPNDLMPEAEVLAVLDVLSWETGAYEGGPALNEVETRTAETWTWASAPALHSSMRLYEVREIMKRRAG